MQEMIVSIQIVMKKNTSDIYSANGTDLNKQDENKDKKKKKWKIAFIAAVLNIVIFIITQDVTKPVIMIDIYTLLMLIIFVLGQILPINKKKKDE